MAKTKDDRKNNGNVHPTRIFQTPDDLLKAWEEYKELKKVEAEKWLKVQYVGKDGQRVADKPSVMPLTLKGFYAFCYNNYGYVQNYFENTQGYYDDFKGIVTHINNERDDNLETGGLLNMFNPNLTARITGLTDRQDLTSGGKELQQEITYKIERPKED